MMRKTFRIGGDGIGAERWGRLVPPGGAIGMQGGL
jgi:hypothetical protein